MRLMCGGKDTTFLVLEKCSRGHRKGGPVCLSEGSRLVAVADSVSFGFTTHNAKW
uniref:TLDc domain-containing protein n=1 Tax=Mesocestoides corti TaxID=53468 RepID=A0A5K3FJL5_MESCO